jgi:methylmalonyl-CoA/ethylmalonyl-CoA epimerase
MGERPCPPLHHLGFVVESIESALPGFVHSLSASWDGRVFEDPLQRVRVAFLATRPNEASIELVEPWGEQAPVRRFLDEKGGGLHHVCYVTPDLDEEIRAFRARRAMVVRPPLPAVAFEGRRIAWLLTPENLLVELLEDVRPPA